MKEYLDERETRIKGRRQKRQLARLARLRRQVLRYVFLSALLFVGTCGFVRIAWHLNDPQKDISVCGNQVVDSEQVRRVLEPCLSRPIYAINPREMEMRVQALPDVRKAFVRRYLLPSPHLVVNIMEEFPWATVADEPGAMPDAVISQSGRLIPLSQFPSVPQPTLKIFGGRLAKIGAKDVELWSNWANYIATQTGSPVDSIDLRNPADVVICTGELNLHVGVADATLSKRLSRLASVVPVVGSLKENIDYINLSLESNVPLKVSKLPRRTETKVPGATEMAATKSLPL